MNEIFKGPYINGGAPQYNGVAGQFNGGGGGHYNGGGGGQYNGGYNPTGQFAQPQVGHWDLVKLKSANNLVGFISQRNKGFCLKY